MLYGALVVTLWTCYGALQIVVLLLLALLSVTCIVTAAESPTDPTNTDVPTTAATADGMHL